jgi:hypothetical protein
MTELSNSKTLLREEEMIDAQGRNVFLSIEMGHGAWREVKFLIVAISK